MTHANALAAALLAISLASAASGGPGDVEVVSFDESRVVVRYHAGELVVEQLVLDGREYASLAMDGTDLVGVQGEPEVPVARATIAVPPCGSVDVRVSVDGAETRDGVRVLPSPTTLPGREGPFAGCEYVEGAAYGGGALWPREAARVFGPSWLASQRVVEIEFFPCQTDPAREVLVLHRSVEVEIVFRGEIPHRPERGASARAEALLRTAVLNYEAGKAWRARPAPALTRPDGDYFTTSEHWAKLRVEERGAYRVGYGDLDAAGITPEGIDPTTVRVFFGGGLPLPSGVNAPRPVWMEECTILVPGEEDGAFDPGDAIVFYAIGADGWADELGIETPPEPYHENPYMGENVYWLTWEEPGTPSGFSASPRRMGVDPLDSLPDPIETSVYRDRAHFEQNTYERQGRSDNWFWYEMRQDGVAERRYFHQVLEHVAVDSTASLRARLDGSSSDGFVNPDHFAILSLNDVEAARVSWDGLARVVAFGDGLPVVDGSNAIQVFVPREDAAHFGDRILIDWFDLIYWRELRASSDQVAFGSSGRTGAIEYSIGGFANTDVTVLKIEDKYTQRVVPGSSPAGGRIVFQDAVADTAAYVAVSEGGYLSPSIEVDEFGDLRSPTAADYLAVVYDGFYEQALELKAHRESGDGGDFDVRLVTVSDVYDEFSWGLMDPVGIRDYLKYTWEHAAVAPTHALLIGDGNSDCRRRLASSRPTYIPVFYTGGTDYWPTDPWYVGFDADSHYHLGMALGRLSAASSTELATMVEKITDYESERAPGIWKNTAVVIGDDEFKGADTTSSPEFFHTQQAEQFAEEILPWPIDRRKVYLMEYESDYVGSKPAARRDVIDAWNDGALIVNYTGHGNEIVMAHENAFLFDDVSLLTNRDRLPVFFAASCRLNKFDMPTVDSLGEALVKSSRGGAIASLGSTRDSAATQNSTLNRAFYRAIFGAQQQATAPVLDIGMAFQAAFSVDDRWTNNTRFSVLGDPGLTIASPRGSGALDPSGLEPMRRRSTVAVAGDNAGTTAGLSGAAILRVTDNADTSGHLHTSPPPQYRVEYRLPGETVFEGPVRVEDGSLDAGFVVSALAEEGPYARLRAYFYNDDTDGAYSLEDVALADSVAVVDGEAPAIALSFEGGEASVLAGAELLVSIFDPHGVNLVDRAPADGIVVTLDGGADSTRLTDDFQYDLDSHERGSVRYRIPDVSFGRHTVTVRASDNMRNRAMESLAFEVVAEGGFEIRNVANHPNPFGDGGSEGTTFLFQLPAAADVEIQIFTVGGRLVRALDGIAGVAGSNQVPWDGRDQQDDELANGVYLYRIIATSLAYRGDKAEAIGRAAVMR